MSPVDDAAREVFDETLRLASEALPEVALVVSGADHRVPVEASLGPITGVRVEQPKRWALVIRTLGVAGEQPPVEQVSINSVGWVEDAVPDPAGLMSVDDATLAWTSVPAPGEPAWIELTWTDPVSADAVVLGNEPGSEAHRLAGIVVRVRTADGEWTTVLDARARLSAWRTAHREELARRFPDDEELVFLDDLLVGVVGGEYRAARLGADQRRPVVPRERLIALRQAANRELLAARRREWTTHGIQRSFRFWSPEEKQTYVRFAADVAADLATLTPNVCFGFGAALAVVRENDLIPHDDDLDLIIAFEPAEAADLPAALDRVSAHLTELGYGVTGDFFAHRHVRAPGRGKKVDVFVGLIGEAGDVSFYPGPRSALRRTDVFPVSTGSVFGIDVPLPADPETYLASQYGPDWRIPNPDFKHSWGRARYRDQSGEPAPAPVAPAARPSLPRRVLGRLRRALGRLRRAFAGGSRR